MQNTDGHTTRNFRFSERFSLRVLAIGAACGAAYWILEAAMDSFLFHQGSFVHRLFKPDMLELWMRGSVLALIVITWGAVHQLFIDRRRSEARLREHAALLDMAPEAILVLDVDGRILSWIRGAEETYGWTRGEALGKSAHELLQTSFPKPFPEFWRELMEVGRWQGELLSRRRDGSKIVVESRWVIQRDRQGRPKAVLEIDRDVTEQKAVQDLIRDSLLEKEVLLKEIHHRVKNNLQIVSTLLELQSKLIVDPRDLRTFKESQDRVRAMALVHEKLYGSNSLARVDLPSYVRSLVGHLVEVYGVDRKRVDVRTEVEDISFSIDKAVPAGLIISELVTNSLKYAFPDGRAGEVRVDLRSQPEGGIRLAVWDDGQGLKPGFDYRHTKSLGLHLVNTLTRQLKGSLELEEGPGTRFTVTVGS